jgi:hypothetical protein
MKESPRKRKLQINLINRLMWYNIYSNISDDEYLTIEKKMLVLEIEISKKLFAK